MKVVVSSLFSVVSSLLSKTLCLLRIIGVNQDFQVRTANGQRYAKNVKKRPTFCFPKHMLPGLEKLASELEQLNLAMDDAERQFASYLESVHPSQRSNARNLLHYLVLRSRDIRELQNALHAYGLSSLTNSESHIKGQIAEILCRLGKEPGNNGHVVTYEESKRSLKEKSTALFGNRVDESIPNIMITFHSHFAEDYGKVKSLLQSGMTVARINCAHDDESTWFRMIQHLKRATYITGIPCKIYMDLAGPKIRTSIKRKKKFRIREGQTIHLADEDFHDGKINDIVGCTVPGIAAQLRPGETVLFDDGLIEAKVQSVDEGVASLQVVRVSSKKSVLRDEKGINFPDSHLKISALTSYDRQCLPFILTNADMMGYSFVRDPSDLDQLQIELGEDNKIPLILKIETSEAVDNLPYLLFRGMKEADMGVMIARGDLAVEIGFERLSEVQEEILWICEAAHVPVIWATQVLENMNKSGLASRSEITDAAHAALADCVMINKGTHIIRVLESLRDILFRSAGHHIKKRYTFRALEIARRFIGRET